MRIDLVVHIAAGGVGILAGFVALYSAKGSSLHRKSGVVFVYAMITMSLIGAGMAAVRGVMPEANIPVGLLTAYLVLTSMATVRPIPGWSRRVDVGLMLVSLTIGCSHLVFGFKALASAEAKAHFLAIPYSVFAVVALLASTGDARVLRFGALKGGRRLARHLWRMSFALALAAFAFFPRLTKLLPKSAFTGPLILLPMLAVLVTMVYWLWRVRRRRTVRGSARIGHAETTARPRAFGEPPHTGEFGIVAS